MKTFISVLESFIARKVRPQEICHEFLMIRRVHERVLGDVRRETPVGHVQFDGRQQGLHTIILHIRLCLFLRPSLLLSRIRRHIQRLPRRCVDHCMATQLLQSKSRTRQRDMKLSHGYKPMSHIIYIFCQPPQTCDTDRHVSHSPEAD